MQSRIILSTKGAEFILNSGATLDDGAAALVPRFSLDFGACVALQLASYCPRVMTCVVMSSHVGTQLERTALQT